MRGRPGTCDFERCVTGPNRVAKQDTTEMCMWFEQSILHVVLNIQIVCTKVLLNLNIVVLPECIIYYRGAVVGGTLCKLPADG